jgi:hypothetical protein
MKSLPYPRGAARAIAQARAGGLKPAETVLIVMAGLHEWQNPQVFADPDQAYRWDWLRGLSVVILIASGTRIGAILGAIEKAQPLQIDVVDFELRRGWLVLGTRPKLKTVSWPAPWVEDWLGACSLLRDLNQVKANAQQKAKKSPNPIFDPEPVWN